MRSWEGKTLLVTGARGFIGQHLVARLKQLSNTRVILLSRRDIPSSEDNLVGVSSALEGLNRQQWVDHGVNQIDLVFHLGAFIPKDGSQVNAVEEIYRDNLEGTRALLDSLPTPPEKIVFASTIDVYAPPDEGQALTEASPTDPSTLYGASKLFCEHLIKAYSRKTGCRHALLRYGHMYGPGEGAFKKFIPQIIKTLLRNESPVLYGDGGVLRDFMFVSDAVEATIRAAASPGENIGPLNITTGQSRPIREWAEILSEIIGFSGGIQYQPDKPGGVSLRFDNARMFTELGRWNLHPLEDGLRQEVEYFKGQP